MPFAPASARGVDAAIIAAAERLGASVLYAEDLNHGQSYRALRVVNPFKAS